MEKKSPAMQEIQQITCNAGDSTNLLQYRFDPSPEDPLEKEMATHSSIKTGFC